MIFRLLKYMLKQAAPTWYVRISGLFAGFMILNTISIFEGYWWEETFSIVSMAMLAAMAVDLLLPRRAHAIKICVQALLLIASTAAYAGIEKLYGKPESWNEWADRLWFYSKQLHPFIWIAGASVLIYLLFYRWVSTRARMIGYVSANLLALTIADSFTPIWLWDQVAWVVLIGLLWLVADHLHRLERSHPGSWQELIEYPLQLFVPVAIVLSILMSIGLLMPTVSPLLQDPYTLWKESKGERVNVFLGDKASSSVVDVSTSDASSGYGRDDSQLGGGFNYDYTPVMTVTTSHRSYWRGETKSLYTGTGWETGEELHAGNPVAVAKEEELPLSYDRGLAETLQIEQTVTMIRKDVYPVLFGAAPITKVHWAGDPDASLPPFLAWEPGVNELRWIDESRSDSKTLYPEAYSILSEVTALDEAGLRNADANWVDAEIGSQYTELPDSLPQRVRDLADQITAGATNDYDRAKLLETYLRDNFTYTNKPDLGKLSNKSTDFVDQFLFELKEGYCDYFSTTMAVMSRSVGLPTRWVKGFAPGTLPASEYGPRGYSGVPDEADMNPNGEGTYTVRNADAHSWVEIYFEGYGWIPFEATAGFSFPYTLPEEKATDLTDLTELSDGSAATDAVRESSPMLTIAMWSIAALLALFAAFWTVWKRQAIVAAWKTFRFRSYTADERIVWETERLLRKCKRKGFDRGEHETLREAIYRWSSEGQSQKDWREVLDSFERAKYSSFKATNEEADRFVVKVKAIITQL
ncbi:transglutaminaseTgpA domain-containing protein [Paenibacillus sp. NEAU-GSW1]|uniref:transglutaminase TgpA family protein n=1 Tax=Paenibacillus sp. NEAU-GSW1 TaxID=2682486 RepID=UPI0012E164EA|nr:transglutaminaseTgpA domain-containing protein [Paenibacillus sp. NEAU-GSW1]MUT66285.1 DUF4129 domain-containing protein [Paenibacillus sp. NEAU-GSW1]